MEGKDETSSLCVKPILPEGLALGLGRIKTPGILKGCMPWIIKPIHFGLGFEMKMHCRALAWGERAEFSKFSLQEQWSLSSDWTCWQHRLISTSALAFWVDCTLQKIEWDCFNSFLYYYFPQKSWKKGTEEHHKGAVNDCIAQEKLGKGMDNKFSTGLKVAFS